MRKIKKEEGEGEREREGDLKAKGDIELQHTGIQTPIVKVLQKKDLLSFLH